MEAHVWRIQSKKIFYKKCKMLYKIRFYFYKLNKIKESNKIMKGFAMNSLETTAAIC